MSLRWPIDVTLRDVGFFFRLLAPKPLKSARRALHPVSLVTPKPVRSAKRAVAKTVNPVGALGDALENTALKAARGGKGAGKRPRTTGGTRGVTRDVHVEDVSPYYQPEHIEPPAVIRTASQGAALDLRTDRGGTIRITVGDVVDGVKPVADFDLPATGSRIVAVRLKLENVGGSSFSYNVNFDGKLLGSGGGEANDWSNCEVDLPVFQDEVRLAPGASRGAFVLYALRDAEAPQTIEFCFGLEQTAEIGHWQIQEVTPAATRIASQAPAEADKPASALSLGLQAIVDIDPQKRVLGALMLKDEATVEAEAALRAAQHDPDFVVRTHALDALLDYGDRYETIGVALDDPHPEIRRRAVKALAGDTSEESLSLLERAAADPDENVRRQAARSSR
jgi:hypothetical protein